MRDINNEAAEIKHMFLLLESRRESSLFFYHGRTEKKLWDFLLLSKHLKETNWLKILQATPSLHEQLFNFYQQKP